MALYRDFDISFEKDALSGDLKIVENEAAVAQSVRTLVLTALYERPFQPSIGSTVSHLLFEQMTDVTERRIAQTIKRTIDQFEPRATLSYVDIYSDRDQNGKPLDGHTIIVDVAFYVYNRPNLVTTTLSLRRLR